MITDGSTVRFHFYTDVSLTDIGFQIKLNSLSAGKFNIIGKDNRITDILTVIH